MFIKYRWMRKKTRAPSTSFQQFSFFLAVLYFASPIKESTNKKIPKMHFAHPKILPKVNLAPLSALHEALLSPFIVVTF